MHVFPTNCPYCETRSVAFTILHEQNYDPRNDCWDTFATCGYCGRGIVATFKTNSNNLNPSKTYKRMLLGIAPPSPSRGAPIHTPENPARFFEQAMDNLSSNWTPPGACSEKRWMSA